MQRIEFDKDAHKDKFRQFSTAHAFSVEPSEGNKRLVKGYVTVWDVLSTDRGGFLALFPKGSMVLPPYEVALQYNHNEDYFLGVEGNGLSFVSDDHGIAVVADLSDDTFIDNYLYAKISGGKIKGMSVGMYALNLHREKRTITEQDAQGNKELLPHVGKTVDVEIYDQWLIDEITITGRPAFPQTDLSIFAKDAEGITEENAERLSSYFWEAKLRGFLLD